MRKIQKNGLVSVIVPIYNVEKYLKRCVDSILDQTYTKLEIILVDDGSTDQSGFMCDIYTQNDSRIRVLHKENGGLSDARNAGLEIANGEYVYFIDSDDFVTDDAVKYLYDSLLSYNADIATHGYVIHYSEDSNINIHELKGNEQLALTNEDALEHLLYEKQVTPSACMKLYRRQLFDTGIRFPAGKNCEDLATTYKLFSKARRIVLNTAPKYFYYQRLGSLTQSDFNDSSMDGFYATKDQLDYINKFHPALTKAAQYRLFTEAIYVIMKVPPIKSQYKNYRKELYKAIGKYKGDVVVNRAAKGSMRQCALVAHFGTGVMVRTYKTRSRMLKRIKSSKLGAILRGVK